jgi:hypothetical protein
MDDMKFTPVSAWSNSGVTGVTPVGEAAKDTLGYGEA